MATLEYSFAVVGKNLIDQALLSVEKRLLQHQRFVDRTFGTSRGARAGAAGATASNRLSTAGKAVAAEEAKVLREQQRQADYYHRARLASARQRHREEVKAAKVEARTREQEEKQASRAVDRERRMQARAQEQETRRVIRDEERARLSGRRTGIQQARALARQEVRAKAQFSEESSEFRRAAFGGAGRGVARVASSVGRTGAALLGIGGSVLAASSVSQFNELDEGARRLSIMGRDAGQAGISPDELRKQFTRTGIATGIAPEEVMAGAAAYTAETGDLTTAIANLQTFATVAQAAGASVEDISRAAAHMQKIGVTSVEDMKQALATLTMQGKKGSYEIRDMAVEFPEVMSSAAKMGINGVAGLTQLGGFMQVVKKATGNASETTTASSQFFNQLVAKSSELESGEALGGRVNVFADKGKTKFRDFRDLIGEVLVASGGNIEKLNDTFEIRGSKAFNPFTSAFNDTREAALKRGASKKEATEEARSAALTVLDSAANAPGDFRTVETDANDAMKSNRVRLQALEIELKDAIAQRLVPELMRLVPQITRLVPAVGAAVNQFVTLASVVADNPLAGIGSLITGYVAAELGKQALADAASIALTKGLGGAFATGGLVFGTLAASIAVATLVIETMKENAERKVGAAAKTAAEIRDKAREELLATGTLSQETRSDLVQLGVTEQGALKKGDEFLRGERDKSPLEKAGGFLKRGFEDLTGGEHGLQEAFTLMETSSNPEFVRGAEETQNLLQLMKQFGEEETARILKAADALKDAADELKKSAGPTAQMPPRGNSPSPVKG